MGQGRERGVLPLEAMIRLIALGDVARHDDDFADLSQGIENDVALAFEDRDRAFRGHQPILGALTFSIRHRAAKHLLHALAVIEMYLRE